MESNRRSRALIADREGDVCEQLHARLEGLEVLSDCVNSGKDTLESLRRSKYELVLLDLNLAPVDVHSILEYLRSMQRQDRPIVIGTASRLTNRTADSEIVQMIIRKPLRLTEVAELIRACISGLARSRDRELAKNRTSANHVTRRM